MKYQCIIFDCDGVLVDSEHITNRVLIEMVGEMGGTIEPAFATEHFHGRFIQDIFAIIEDHCRLKLPETMETEWRARTFKRFEKEIQPIVGVEEVIKQLKVPICVASSGPPHKIRLNLRCTGLLDHFEPHIFSAYDIGKWKPDPGVFLHAAETMGFAPAECAVIEDSISGIKAARNGGFDAYGYTSVHKNAFEEEGAQVFNHMNQLLQLLY